MSVQADDDLVRRQVAAAAFMRSQPTPAIGSR